MENIKDSEKPNAAINSALEIKTENVTFRNLIRCRTIPNNFSFIYIISQSNYLL